MPVELTVEQRNFVEVRARLKSAGNGGLTRELNRSLKEAAKPIESAEKAGALALPAHGPVSTGLRQEISGAVATRISSSKSNPGVTVYVRRGSIRGNIGADTNKARGWRHPVFGNRNAWVQQVMSPGWWGRTARPGLKAAQERVQQALDRVAAKIAR